MAAHTYWRLLFTATPATNRIVIDLLSFYDATTTLLPTTGGTASASSVQSGSNAANAFDGSVNGNWWIGNSTSVTPATPEWLQYQFASAVDVASFVLAPRQSFSAQWPCDFALQYSDNGTTWTTLYQYYGAFYPGNSGSSPQAWTCTAANAVPALGIAFRLLVTSVQGGAGTQVGIAEVQFFDSGATLYPTARIAAPSSSVASGEGDGGYAAFDGSTTTYWQSNNAPSVAAPEWVAYWFANAATFPSTFSVTSRNLQPQYGPVNFSLQSSTDNSTWTTRGTYTAAAWAGGGSTQTFTVAPPASIAVSPASAAQGASTTLTVTGTSTHFAGGTTTVSFSGTGITVGTITVASATSLTAAITISPTAATGSYTMTVTTGAEAPTATFTVSVGIFQRGNIDYDQVRTAARQGSGAKFQMAGTGSVTAGHALVYDASGSAIDGGAPASGSVTSVGLSAPSEFTVSGSPVTGAGTLSLAKNNQSANQVYAGPSSGAAAAPTFRALAVGDLPAGTTGSVSSVGLSLPAEFTVTGSPVTTSGTLTAAKATQTANQVYAGPSSGAAASPTFRALASGDVPPLTKVNGTAQVVSIDNFNDTTPAAPGGTGRVNIQWQRDASGNISANAGYGAWATYSLGVTAVGAMTIATSNVITARWVQLGGTLYFLIAWQGQFGGTAGSQVNFSLPGGLTGATGPICASAYVAAGVPPFNWAAIAQVTGSICQLTLVQTTFPLATTINISLSGFYEVI
jgi:hypothetical protein